jgi:sulfide:quinone oxidoreductase
MARVVIVGGGFGGVVATESLAKKLGVEHEITLVSRSPKFLFYPALVRLAFGDCEPDDIVFDLREAMLDRKVRFVEGDVARIDLVNRHITFGRGDFVGNLSYDFLILALGRRLKTEQITGFFEHAHHILGVRAAKKFGDAARGFDHGHAVIGFCPGARLPVPVFETAFALSRRLEETGKSDHSVTIASNQTVDEMFGGTPISKALTGALESHRIELLTDFAITEVSDNSLIARDGRKLSYDLNLVIPPFGGPAALIGTGLTDDEGYARVDRTMQVKGTEGVYAVGDCVSFDGPKMAHMAIRQGEVAAENVVAEIEGKPLSATYDHDMMLVIDAGGAESIFVHKDLWSDDHEANIQRSRFWGWAKRKQEQYWKATHR